MKNMLQYQKFELSFQGTEPEGSQSQIDFTATFTCQGEGKTVSGFYAGNGKYIVRYLPQRVGLVQWKINGLFSEEGEEECISCDDGIHHGLVKPNGTALIYEDGTSFRPFGTTVYAMMHQPEELIAQTIETLIASPFDKVRTCIFPKHYIFNENEPQRFAFEKKADGGFDYQRPCFGFWDALEKVLKALEEHQIEVDLILFHPYDHWGFSKMDRKEYLSYLDYLTARFAAYPNVWWSLANEYDVMDSFQKEDWDCIDRFISEKDVYGHMLSCHHMLQPYDFSKENVTHCSIQGDVTAVEKYMKKYHKPVLMDEFGYEGNIFCHWGHLSAFEMVHRFWICCVNGGYGTHGETFMNSDDTLWWSKGGRLTGKSSKRIGFLKTIINELPGALEPIEQKFVSAEMIDAMREGKYQDQQTDFTRALLKLPRSETENVLESIEKDIKIYTGHCSEDAYLAYYGRHCTAVGELQLPENGKYRIEVIDIWEMTRETVLTGVNGKVKFSLPGKEGMAVLAMKQKEIFNPYLPSFEYIPDGEPHVFGDRLYIYGSHDRFRGADFCLNDYVCYSASIYNLSAWKYEGVIYRKEQDPRNQNIPSDAPEPKGLFGVEPQGTEDLNPAGIHAMFAPDVVKGIDGRYYLYYCLDNLWEIAVAVCDTPAGSYEFLGFVRHEDGIPLGQRKGDKFQFDPGVFVDDDETVYLYSGNAPIIWPSDTPAENQYSMVMTLKPDMLTIDREPVRLMPDLRNSSGTGYEGHEFFEASSIRKIQGKYYFVYSSVKSHELCYAVSDYPDRGYQFGGTLVDIGDVFLDGRTEEDSVNCTGNTHGGIECVNGQWYVFYHRQTNRTNFSRQGCAEKIFFDQEGKISQAEVTSCGLNEGPLAGAGKYPARICCHLTAKNGAVYSDPHTMKMDYPYLTQDVSDLEPTAENIAEDEKRPVQYIRNMQDGSTAGYKYFDLNKLTEISVWVRGNAEGFMKIRNSLTGTELGRIPIAIHSEDWELFGSEMKTAGPFDSLYFTYEGNGNLDFLEFLMLNGEESNSSRRIKL